MDVNTFWILGQLFLLFLIALPFLYDLSGRFRYHLKFAVYSILLLAVSATLTPLYFFRATIGHNFRILSKWSSIISRILNIQWNLEMIGCVKEPCIFIYNYQNSLDLLGILELWPYLGNCTLIIKNNHLLVRNPIYLVFCICQAEPVFTFEPYYLENRFIENKKEQLNVWVHQGEIRSKSDDTDDLRDLSIYTAIDKRIPVIPFVFSKYYFLDEERKMFEPGYVSMKMLPPVRTECTEEEIPQLIYKTKSTMNEEFQSLSKATTPPSIEELRRSYFPN